MDYYNPELKEVGGLDIGDVITHINGKTFESIIDSIKIYYAASNEVSGKRQMANDLLRSSKHSLIIDYISTDRIKRKKELPLHNGGELNMNPKDSTPSYKLLNDDEVMKNGDIGYVTLKTIKDEDIDKIKKDFKNTKGMIIYIFCSHVWRFLKFQLFLQTNRQIKLI